MEKTKNLNEQLASVTQNTIDAICGIKQIPEGLLPHTVYVEEENSKGEPYYRKYQMVDIDRTGGNCIVYDQATGLQEEISLEDINIDWLITFWNRYSELSVKEEQFPETLCVFLYPRERFSRNATDEEITAGYETGQGQGPCVEKYTPDEFAAMLNDGGFLSRNLYIRFINY